MKMIDSEAADANIRSAVCQLVYYEVFIKSGHFFEKSIFEAASTLKKSFGVADWRFFTPTRKFEPWRECTTQVSDLDQY